MTLSYETAARLKAAGFPQPDKDLYYPGEYLGDHAEDKRAYAPTLGELITAIIGEKPNTFSLDFNEEWSVYEEPNKDGPWSARYYDLTPVGFYECGAKSPEEAAAAIYLALHA